MFAIREKQTILAANKVCKRSVVKVGAPPASVEAGLPGARDEVRAYAERINKFWDDFYENDVMSWAEQNGFGKAEYSIDSVLGDTIGGTKEQQEKAKKNINIFDTITNDKNEFKKYKIDISGFSFSGPTPSEAWQKLQLFESKLIEDRQLLSKTGDKLTTKNPKDLEKPGGVDQGLPSLSTVIISIVVIAGTVFVVKEFIL